MAENNTVVEATWNDVQLEDSLGMEVGYRLIPMVDFQQDGELLGRIRSIRKKFAQEMGFLPPVVHIRDNMDLQPARYRILMKGVEIGSGDAYPGRWLAINPGTAAGTLPGEATVDPAFGLNAIWIESALKEQAQIQGYTVVEASTVVATHLNHLISQHAAELFGRQEAQQLLDRVAQEMPKLTEDPFLASSRLPHCIKCCKICSMKKCRFAICAPFSKRWRNMRPSRAIRMN